MTQKLPNAIGRKSVTVEPSPIVKGAPVQFTHPDRHTTSMQPTAPQGYRWAHLQPNPRTGT